MRILDRKEHIPHSVLAASRKHYSGDCTPHWHDFFEIEYILSGEGTYQIDGITHKMEPGSLCLLSSANIHAVTNAEVEMFNVMFTCEPGDAILRLLTNGAAVLRLDDSDRQLAEALLAELVTVQEQDRNYALTLLQCLLQKLVRVSHVALSPLPLYTHRAILYLLNGFRRGITLEETARHLGLSKAYFSDLFLKQTGKNFKTYLDDLRFTYAENLLLLTDLPVGEIYLQAGFHDYANFARRFKGRHGKTPGEYRAQKGENAEKL
ncbi:MAG: helix-turn-helix transcriptional regulator [Clostridia bacterium]|nr:helix-turn-helix transcriptional regulator [Clostridia bacterium]